MLEFKKISKYTLISGGALCVDYLIYLIFLNFFHTSVLASSIIGYSTGLILAYILLRAFCFTDDYSKSEKSLLFWFIGSGVLGVNITFLGMFISFNILGFNHLFSRVLVTGLSFSVIYVFRRLYVFKVFN